MGKPFQIRFGAMSPPLVEQFKAMDLDDFEAAEKWQAVADARTMLYLNGLLTAVEEERVRDRIFKAMTADLEKRGTIVKARLSSASEAGGKA